MDYTYIITFDNASSGEANLYADELRNMLLNTVPGIKMEQRQDNQRAQDFGSTLVLILGAPAITMIAKAIGTWLQLRNTASITIETPEKKVIVSHITSNTAASLAKQLLDQR